MDTDVILILDNKDKKITFTGKARGVTTDVDHDYEDIYSDYDSAFPRSYVRSVDAKTIVEWAYDEGKAYTMKVEEKKKMTKSKLDRIVVSFMELEDEVYEARGEHNRLSFHVDGGVLYIKEISLRTDRFDTIGAVRDWLSVKYEPAK